MADTFGRTPSSRVQADSSRFYAVAVADVAANAIYVPNLETGLFGVAEVPVEAGKLGAFAREGIFAFDYPEGASDAPTGTEVRYVPSSASTGAFSFGETGVFIGYVVDCPDVPDKMCVLLAPNTFETASGGEG